MTGRLRIRNVSVDLGDAPVLQDVSLDLEPGAWVNVIGPNGAGKTTLLRAILGAVDHTGEIDLGEGTDRGDAMSRARALAYLPQTPTIPAGVPVIDYVLLGRTPHRGVFAADSRGDLALASDVLERLDLAGFAQREVGSLSGGERQRVVLARALVQQSAILLLDEPTTALDLGHQQDVLDLVDELRTERGLTVLATLHDLTLAARYGDRVAALSGGRIVAHGPPRDVVTEELILTHFNASVRIIDDVDGPVIVPVAGRTNQEPT
ncbi:MAG: cobalamin/Fe3+-siderophore ABC transporter ATP-binding protein [Acidimicrobiales bacterium]|nr:MAG: cobalamin/Fe3+-siderophore ABC transporter ATP-binding protein [Acidimicrobiales bacterium]